MRIIPLVMAIILGTAGTAAAQPHGHGPGKPKVMVWKGSFGKGRLGVQINELTDELRVFFGGTAGSGVLVAKVEKDTPAAKAGVQVGDVIVSVGGTAVGDTMDVITALGSKKKGDAVDVVVLRNKQKVTLRATMTEDPGKGTFDSMGNFDVVIPDFDDLDDLKGFQAADPKMKQRLEQMEKQMRELEKQLEQLRKNKQP